MSMTTNDDPLVLTPNEIEIIKAIRKRGPYIHMMFYVWLDWTLTKKPASIG